MKKLDAENESLARMTEEQRQTFAVWIIHFIEPSLGKKLDVSWIRQYDSLASTIQPNPKLYNQETYKRPISKFAEYTRRYINNDGFMPTQGGVS